MIDALHIDIAPDRLSRGVEADILTVRFSGVVWPENRPALHFDLRDSYPRQMVRSELRVILEHVAWQIENIVKEAERD